MPIDLWKRPNGKWRVDISMLHPEFFLRINNVLAACVSRGAHYYPTFGFRSMGLQNQLHLKWRAGLGGRAAPAGFSSHNYGLAGDFARDGDEEIPGLQPVWDPIDYEILGEEAEKAGLAWGGDYNDRPHVQVPGFETVKQLQPLLNHWNSLEKQMSDFDKLKQVWQHCVTL